MDSVKYAIKISVLVGIFHIISVTLYVFLVTNAHIPATHIVKYTVDFIPSKQLMTASSAYEYYFTTTTSEPGFVRIKLGILNCCTLHLAVIGSLLLTLLGGYGLALFPIEFLNSFLNRPQIVSIV